MRAKRPLQLLVLATAALAVPVMATFHLMRIVEVFPGTPAAPNAQYVVLQMFASGQNLVDSHTITVFNSAGVLVGTFIFDSNVSNGASQSKILIATSEAQSFFNVTADLTMTPAMIAAGGKACFSDTIDCIAWGSYSGSSTGVGTPYNVASGLRPGKVAKRRLDIAGSASVLDAGDDTDNCANDFIEGLPAPRNNAGVLGTVPAATCGNGAIEGLEQCDDHNLVDGDGCSSTCQVTPAPPSLSVNDVTVSEGNSGTKLANFTVSVAPVSASPVGFDISTAPGTAMPDQDYVSQTLVGQSIPASQASANFAVTINGDTQVENNETFTVNLANVSGATVADGQGKGTIANDDNPSLSIADVSLPEGDSGNSTATFAIRLSAPMTSPVSFDVATANGTATAGSDYIARSQPGKVIDAGRTRSTFEVAVTGDANAEADETFAVNVSNVSGASVADGAAVGTIQNDDAALVPISQIQGDGLVSPMLGKPVTTRGVVTARTSDGFFLQSLPADADARSSTSEGLFVASTQAAPDVGDSVRVKGTARELLVGEDPEQSSLTAVAADSVLVLDRGQALPAAIAIDSRVAGPGAGPAALESLEGMRVKTGGLVVVAPVAGSLDATGKMRANGRFYAVLAGLPRPFREPGLSALEAQGAVAAARRFDGNPERLQIDSAGQRGAAALLVDAGQGLSGIEGVLGYGEGSYRVMPDPGADVSVTGSVSPRAVPRPATGELSLASMNLRQEQKSLSASAQAQPSETMRATHTDKTAAAICTYLNAPDVLAVTGVANSGALAELAQATAHRQLASISNTGCEATAGYRTYSAGKGASGFLVASTKLGSGQPRLEVESVSVVELSSGYRNRDGSREALYPQAPQLLQLRENLQNGTSRKLVVLLAELSPVDGSMDAPGGQGWSTRAGYLQDRRHAQATALARWLHARQLAHPGEAMVVLADLDASEFDEGHGDLAAIVSGARAGASGPAFENLTLGLPSGERYNAVRAGNALALDHVFVNHALRSAFPALHLEVARLNADFGADSQDDAQVPMRFASHDPEVLYLP